MTIIFKPLQPHPKTEKLLQIIAATYQIAGACDAPAHVLDVLANPVMATQGQIDALLPFVSVQPVPQNLQKRLADLHMYEEIAEHYAKCAVSPEALRDWVADRLSVQPAQPTGQLCEEFFGRGRVMWFNKPADGSMLYASPFIAQPEQPPQRPHHD